MDSDVRRSQENLYRILDETLPIVHVALIGVYGFSEPDAQSFQDTLCVWFHRVTRRPSSSLGAFGELREQLLFVTCKYARAFQIARLRGAKFDDRLNVALGRPSEEVAVELLSRLPQPGVCQ